MRRQGTEGFLDIHTSTGLKVTHVMGPVTPLDRTKLSSNSMQRHNKPTMNASNMVSVETGQAIAVGLEVTRDLEGEYAFMQVSQTHQPGSAAGFLYKFVRLFSVVGDVYFAFMFGKHHWSCSLTQYRTIPLAASAPCR